MTDSVQLRVPQLGSNADAVMQRFRQAEDLNPFMQEIVDTAIAFAGADMGTMQRFDDGHDCLRIVASRGFTQDALQYFDVVRRDTNTTVPLP